MCAGIGSQDQRVDGDFSCGFDWIFQGLLKKKLNVFFPGSADCSPFGITWDITVFLYEPERRRLAKNWTSWPPPPPVVLVHSVSGKEHFHFQRI